MRARLLGLDYLAQPSPVLLYHRLATDRSAVRARRPRGSGLSIELWSSLPTSGSDLCKFSIGKFRRVHFHGAHAINATAGPGKGSMPCWKSGAPVSRPPMGRERATAEATGTSAIRRSQRRASTPQPQRPRRRSGVRAALSRGLSATRRYCSGRTKSWLEFLMHTRDHAA